MHKAEFYNNFLSLGKETVIKCHLEFFDFLLLVNFLKGGDKSSSVPLLVILLSESL